MGANRSTDHIPELRKQIRQLPKKPGCYIFKSGAGDILYVGKAKVLRNRATSYLSKDLQERTAMMVSEARSVDFIVTENELEALMLENNLIKKHRPPYNIFMRDDKSYPYVVITVADKYPRLSIMRRPRIKGAKIYGPYTAKATRQTVDFLRGIFPICTCRTPEKGRNGRCPCLDYHIGKCMAPCLGADPDEYHEMVTELCMFLEGKRGEILNRLEKQMKTASEEMRFERAAALRDRIKIIKGMLEDQKAVSISARNADVVGFASSATSSVIQLLSVREGLLIDSKFFAFPYAPEEEVVGSFVSQYYTSGPPIPPEILLPLFPEESEMISELLSKTRGAKVQLTAPMRGEKKKLVAMAIENAAHSLEKEMSLETKSIEQSARLIEELRQALSLEQPPRRIECYDISTTMGRNSVGSLILFIDGRPEKAGYRKFRIRKDPGLDDVGMMKEVLTRRLKHLGSETKDRHFAHPPDLIVVDGGIGQTNAVASVLDDKGHDIPIVGLAKRLEELYLPGKTKDPIRLKADSAPLRLLQQMRDEAHRFAISYHRSLRSQEMTKSALDSIPGIGATRRRRLLAAFSSLEELSQASEDQIIKATGVPRTVASMIIERVKGELGGP